MNDIIKNIEAAQLKEQAPEFRVGDTVNVSLEPPPCLLRTVPSKI